MKPFALVTAFVVAMAAVIPAAAQQPAPNPYSDRLRRLPPNQQRAVLRRAVLDSGQFCRRADAAAWRGPYRNLQMWTVQCTPGGSYGVFIGLDQSVQVRACSEMAKLRLPACAARAAPNRTR